MHWINNTDNNRLVIKSYPLALVSLPIAFMLVATIGLMFGDDSDLRLIDGLMFYGFCIAFISFHKYRSTVLDKRQKECSIFERNLFTQKEVKLPLSDIEAFKLSFGRGGSHARGGLLRMRMKDGTEFHIIDSDIQRKHEKKTTKAKDEIEAFIGN